MIRKHKEPFYRRTPVLILAGGLVLLAGSAVASLFLIGNNDDDADVGTLVKETIPSVSTAGTAGGADELTTLNPSEASINLQEIPGDYEVDVPNTFAMTVSTFSSSYWFKADQEGQDLSREWRIIGGHQVYYQPRGLAAEVLTGSPYLRVETYQFFDVNGAKKAWAHLDALMKRTVGSDQVEANALANDSAGYRYLAGTVGTSETPAVYHRFSFRRGNTIVTVQTWGADPFMNIDSARNVAASIDQKLLGTRPAVEPTPIPTPAIIPVVN